MDDSPAYCDHCVLPSATAEDGHGHEGGYRQEGGHGHERCRAARALEPPRYCPLCGRRTVVKVTPHSWSSRCSRHGTATGRGDPGEVS
jgi:hypothetical protein